MFYFLKAKQNISWLMGSKLECLQKVMFQGLFWRNTVIIITISAYVMNIKISIISLDREKTP
jgi:hypothetical protein